MQRKLNKALYQDIHKNKAISRIINVPNGFGFTPDITFYYDNGSISTKGYDLATRADIPTGKTYYVNPSTGNNSNDGTTAITPLKDISTAIAKADVDVVILAPGVYNRLIGGWKGVTCTRSVTVKSDGTGTVTLTNHQEFASGSWTQDATYTNVWSCTRNFAYNVLNSTQTDANGDYVQCTKQTSIANCNGVSNSFFISGSLVYVNLDGANPSTRAWILVDNNIVCAGNTTIYLENLNVIGGTQCVIHENTGAGQTPKFFAKNCTFKFASGNGVQMEGVSLAILQNCVAAKNVADGFNYHAQNSVQINVVEIDCISRDNGSNLDALGNDQGSSLHESGKAVRVNSQYYRNIGGNVVDIDTTQTWMLGCTMHTSNGTSGNNYNFGGISAWLDTCNLYNSTVDIIGSTYVRNTTYSTINGTAMPY